MKFSEFKSKVTNLEKIDLPGEEAHYKLAPLLRITELADIDIDSQKPNQAGVLAVFYPNTDDDAFLVLILRKTYKGVHSNQVGFPGGRVEHLDEDLEQTALRETEEEVGIPRNDVQVLKKLTRLYIPPSNFWVHPYVGLLEKTPYLVMQEDEVEEIIEVNLDHFLDEENMITEVLSTSYAENIEVPAFKLNGHVVWGATAMMLSELKDLLRKVL